MSTTIYKKTELTSLAEFADYPIYIASGDKDENLDKETAKKPGTNKETSEDKIEFISDIFM